jgi:hypothetical protein
MKERGPRTRKSLFYLNEAAVPVVGAAAAGKIAKMQPPQVRQSQSDQSAKIAPGKQDDTKVIILSKQISFSDMSD